MKKMKFLALAGFVLFACCIRAQDKSAYSIVNRIHLDGDAGWDYLTMDEPSGLLFVSHGNMVQVVDVKTAKVISSIQDTKGVHGIAIATEAGKGYISCGQDSSVVVFDLKIRRRLAKIQVTGKNPDAIVYDPFSKNIFAFNGRTSNVSVIDPKSDKVTATIPLDGKPEFAVVDGKGKIYVNIEDKSSLSVINGITLKVENTWPLAPGENPSGLAIDNVNHRLFSVCENKTMVITDAGTGKVISNLPIGAKVDGVAFDPAAKRVFSSNGDGTMTVIGEENGVYKVLENFPTQKGVRTIAVDSRTHHIYLPVAEFGQAPVATPENPHPHPGPKAGTFTLLEIAPL